MSAQFDIRLMIAVDAVAAVALLDALLPGSWRDGPLPDPARMAQALSHRHMILIGAWADHNPAGYVSGSLNPSLTARGDVAMLDDLYVAEAYRRRGLGSKLTRAFRDEVLKRGRAPVAMWGGTGVDNEACQQAFRSAGAAPLGETYREYNWPTK